MDHAEAIALIREGVPPGGVWADLGAGTGAFTRALSELLGEGGTVYAIDREAAVIEELRRLANHVSGTVIIHHADFTAPLDLPKLDGVLMANALHYARDQAGVLRQVKDLLRPDGRLILVEYDQQRGNPWVPYPVPLERFSTLAAQAGFDAPREIGRRRSSFGREMYAALAVVSAQER